MILITCCLLLLCWMPPAQPQSQVINNIHTQACGIKVEDVTFAIFNAGDNPKIAPWAVSIGYADKEEDYHHHCSGSIIHGILLNTFVLSHFILSVKLKIKCIFLIAEKAVLTAAHCLTDPRFDRFIVIDIIYIGMIHKFCL